MRIAVISDIHGNLEALERVLERARDFDYLIVLGDLVDYGPDPDIVIDVIRGHSPIAVRGNHDHAAAFNVDCGCGELTHDISVYTRENITSPKLSEGQRAYLSSLPLTEVVELNGVVIGMVHGSIKSPLYGYVYPWEAHSALCQRGLRMGGEKIEGCELPYDLLLLGHTHHQFVIKIGRTLVVNPGSVGQPRDGDPRASFSVINVEGDPLEIALHRVKYDVEKTVRKLEALVERGPYLDKLKRALVEGRVF